MGPIFLGGSSNAKCMVIFRNLIEKCTVDVGNMMIPVVGRCVFVNVKKRLNWARC